MIEFPSCNLQFHLIEQVAAKQHAHYRLSPLATSIELYRPELLHATSYLSILKSFSKPFPRT